MSPAGKILEFIQEQLPVSMAGLFGHGDKGSIIFEAEMFAVLAALKAWKRFLYWRPIVIHVNSDAVRHAIAAPATRHGIVGHMLDRINCCEMDDNLLVWVARVPTKNNIADKPSRGEWQFLASMGASKSPCN